MAQQHGLIAIDWGSSNRRIYVLDADGQVRDKMRDTKGVLHIARADFPKAFADLRAQYGDVPLILAGMVGSSRGWIETPYVPTPVDMEKLASSLLLLPSHHSAVVPGISHIDGLRCDVMRGEEIQILGAIHSDLIAAQGLICHPGTHSKWVKVEASAITGFATIMTGELFALLRQHSILSEHMNGPVVVGTAFRSGVARALDNFYIGMDIFSIRAAILLARMHRQEAASYASGLLIGHDIQAGLAYAQWPAHNPILLIGDPYLTGLYGAALDMMGTAWRALDGETAFLSGISILREYLP